MENYNLEKALSEIFQKREMVDVNEVSLKLKRFGINVKNEDGEFKAFAQVINEISDKIKIEKATTFNN